MLCLYLMVLTHIEAMEKSFWLKMEAEEKKLNMTENVNQNISFIHKLFWGFVACFVMYVSGISDILK